jgi:hypothetical protein
MAPEVQVPGKTGLGHGGSARRRAAVQGDIRQPTSSSDQTATATRGCMSSSTGAPVTG